MRKKKVSRAKTGKKNISFRKLKRKRVSKGGRFGRTAKRRGRLSELLSRRKRAKKEREKRKEKELAGKGGIDEFVKLGKQRGFVTEDEILQIIPEVEKNVAELEKLYEKLEQAGVKVVSSDEVIKEEAEQEAETGKKSRRYGYSAGSR